MTRMELYSKHFPGMTVPEPSAFKVRAELRRYPTSKLRELCEALGSGQMTGIEILDRNRDAISACKEILWERGKLWGDPEGGDAFKTKGR